MVKKYVRSAFATQTEIISVFGAPNIHHPGQGRQRGVDVREKQCMASASEVAEWNASGAPGRSAEMAVMRSSAAAATVGVLLAKAFPPGRSAAPPLP